MDYSGRTVLVTGAGRGLGRAYAIAFADAGAHVVVLGPSAPDLERVTAEIEDRGGRALVGVADVTDEEAVAAVVARTVEEFGGLDVLVNNAGLQLGRYNECLTLEPEHWRRLLDVNLLGAVVCTRACRPHLAVRDGAAVLNQSSVAAGAGAFGAYGVSKLALDGLTRAMAVELGPEGIRVNGIAPGVIVTPEREADTDPGFLAGWVAGQAVGRPGRPHDLVGLALYLCSDQAAFVTGQTVAVDGGHGLGGG